MEWVKSIISEIDPALNTAIGSITAAVSMAIITIVSYYFPKDHSRFDEYEESTPPKKKKKAKKKRKPQVLAEENGGTNDEY